MKKLKTKALLLVSLASALTITGCQKELSPDEGKEEDDKSQVKRLTSISFKEDKVTLEEEGSVDLIIQYNPENISSSQKAIKYTSSDEKIAIVDENFGTVTAIKAGTATITATSLVDPTIKATCEVTVTAKDRSIPVERVVLDKEDVAIAISGYTFINAKVLGANNAYATDTRLTWSSDHPEIATIDSASRKISGISAGTAVITATSVANPSAFASVTVEVMDTYVKVASVSVSPTLTTIQVNSRTQLADLTATVLGENDATPTDSRVLWSVIEGEDKITISPTSLNTAQVKAVAAGTARVRVSSVADDTKYAECQITVQAEAARDLSVHAETIDFVGDADSVTFGQQLVIAAVVSPDNTGYPEYTLKLKDGSTLPTGTTFDPTTGVVVAGNVEGSFIVEAIADDTTNGIIKAERTIRVKDPVIHVTGIDTSIGENTTLYLEDTLNLANGSGLVSVVPANATDAVLEYESSNQDVVSIDSNGLVTAKAVTTVSNPVKITIKSHENPSIKREINITVKDIPVSRVVLSANTRSLYSGESFNLSPTIYFKSPNKDDEDDATVTDVSKMTFVVTSGTDVASVSDTGLVTALKQGSATIQVYLTSDPSVKGTCVVNVTSRKPLVMSLNLQNSLYSYERKTDEENLTPIEGLKDNNNAPKSEFFADSEENLMYKVGDVNEFKFNPIVKARIYNEAGAEIGTETYNDAEVEYSYELDGTALDASDVATYLTKSATGFTFTSEAIDHVIKVNMVVKQSDNYDVNGNVPNDFTFKVIKGYNAYTIEELSYVDNTTDTASGINWGAIRSEKGLPSFDAAKDGAVILHNDIQITSSVLPDNMLWTEEAVDQYIATPSGRSDFQAWMQLMGIEDEDEGKLILYNSPKDYISLFSTFTNDNDDYRIEGNFYTIDTSNLAVVKRMVDHYGDSESLITFQNGDGSHAQVFGINAASQPKDSENPHSFGSYTVNNLKFIGNGGIQAASAKAAAASTAAEKNRYTGDIRLAKGGYIAFKAGHVNFNVNNVINTGSFISFMSEKHDYNLEEGKKYTHMSIDRAKAYDSYNSSIYIWGTEDNKITNSWFTEAGGPLILMDEPCWDGKPVGSNKIQRSACEVVNTYLRNPVTGAEPWFEQHNASSLVRSYLVDAGNPTIDSGWLGKLAQLVASINGQDTKTITKKDSGGNTLIDFVVIDMCAGNFAGNTYPLLGKFTVKDSEADEGFSLDMTRTTKNGSYHTPLVDDVSKIIVESDLGGVEYINASNQPSYAAAAAEYMADSTKTTPFVSGSNYYKVVNSNYLSYYLDIKKGTGQGDDGAFIGIFLGTYSYGTYWGA